MPAHASVEGCSLSGKKLGSGDTAGSTGALCSPCWCLMGKGKQIIALVVVRGNDWLGRPGQTAWWLHWPGFPLKMGGTVWAEVSRPLESRSTLAKERLARKAQGLVVKISANKGLVIGYKQPGCHLPVYLAILFLLILENSYMHTCFVYIHPHSSCYLLPGSPSTPPNSASMCICVYVSMHNISHQVQFAHSCPAPWSLTFTISLSPLP